MGEVPFVSIIIPTRNRVARLGATLKALSLLDYPKEQYDIVVIEDGSSDGTREAVERISSEQRVPAVRYLRSEGDGANAARNAGIQASEGDLVCLVDDDVLPPAQWLRNLIAPIVSDGLELSWGPVILPPELHLPGRHRSEVVSYLSESRTPEIPLLCNMLTRRIVFQRGLFDPRWFAPVEEIEWLLRTNPSRAFAEAAWLWHNKSQEDCQFATLMRLAWRRGMESGKFDRTRRSGFAPLGHAIVGAIRSVGHAIAKRCSGGLLVAAGRAGYVRGYALAGLTSRSSAMKRTTPS